MIARPGRVSRSVAQQVIEAHRRRCCLCRVLVDPLSPDPLGFAESLEKHHLVFVSRGGDDGFENLVLLCPTCHARVHAHPGVDATELLRARRAHWIGMKAVVPPRLALDGLPASGSSVAAQIELLSVALSFQVDLPDGPVPLAELADFVHGRIIRPLADYDRNGVWQSAAGLWLVHRSDMGHGLPAAQDVRELLRPDDPFVPLLTFEHRFAAQGAAPHLVRMANAKGALKRMQALRHTTRTLQPDDGDALPLALPDLSSRWRALLEDPRGRGWIKKVALALEASAAWREPLDEAWQFLHRPLFGLFEVWRLYAQQREELHAVYLAAVAGEVPPAPEHVDTLWSILLGLLLAAERATVELLQNQD